MKSEGNLNQLSILMIFNLVLFVNACKSPNKGAENGDSNLASSDQPTTGERKGKIGSSRVKFEGVRDVENMLAVRIWRHLAATAKSSPTLVDCKDVPGANPTKACITYDPKSRADQLYCFAQSDTAKFNANKLHNVHCDFVSSDWPKLSSYLSTTVLNDLLKKSVTAAGDVSIGKKKQLNCNGAPNWDCAFKGFDNDVKDYLAKRLVIRPVSIGSLTPARGELDELSRPLPKSSAESKVQVGGEFVVAKTYKASDAVLKEFMTYLPIDSVKDFDAHLADVGYKANCRNPEIYALMDYSGDGYKDVNAALRKLDLEGAQSTKLDPVLNSRVRSTISGLNCAKKIKSGVVVRGATLSSDKLKRYEKGKFVVEPAFTSTTIGEETLLDFKGNVEFQIFDAVGADLTNLSLRNENGEQELLFQAGSLFKVVGREEEGSLTVIKMVYAP
jgi:hypothetical protein